MLQLGRYVYHFILPLQHMLNDLIKLNFLELFLFFISFSYLITFLIIF